MEKESYRYTWKKTDMTTVEQKPSENLNTWQLMLKLKFWEYDMLQVQKEMDN
jgi:hypothetical protein